MQEANGISRETWQEMLRNLPPTVTVEDDPPENTEPPGPFHSQQQAIERAAAHAQQQLDKLDPNIFQPFEIERRRNEILAQFDEAAAGPRQVVAEAEQQARDELIKTQLDDPLDHLTAAQMAMAETHRWVVEEDAALPYDEVVPRLRAALVENQPAFLALWHRYLGRRLDSTRKQQTRWVDLDGVAHGQGEADPIPAELFEVWRQLEQKLANPQREERRKRAEGTINDAMAFQHLVLKQTRMRLTGEFASNEKATRAHYAEVF